MSEWPKQRNPYRRKVPYYTVGRSVGQVPSFDSSFVKPVFLVSSTGTLPLMPTVPVGAVPRPCRRPCFSHSNIIDSSCLLLIAPPPYTEHF